VRPPPPPPLPFPLAPFLPAWHRWARLFPAFCDPSIEDPVTVSSAPLPGVMLTPMPRLGLGAVHPWLSGAPCPNP